MLQAISFLAPNLWAMVKNVYFQLLLNYLFAWLIFWIFHKLIWKIISVLACLFGKSLNLISLVFSWTFDRQDCVNFHLFACVQFRLEKPMGYIAITFQWICLYGIKPIITSINFACHGHKQLSIEMTWDYQTMEHWLNVLPPTTWNWRVRISI
jgi:hypothetical protein